MQPLFSLQKLPLRTAASYLWAGLRKLLIVLLVLEAATRLFSGTEQPLSQRDALVGRRYIPAPPRKVFNEESQKAVEVRFNSAGFRGPDWPLQKPPGVRRVAILGDSMIAALQVEEQQTLADQLKALLKEEHPAADWEVLNFGVEGSSPAQAMVLYKEVVAAYQPDVVLCTFFIGNDLADSSPRLSSNPRIYFDFDERGVLRQLPLREGASASAGLNRWCRFYVWQKEILKKLTSGFKLQIRGVSPGDWIYCRRPPENVAHAWELVAATLKQFHEEVTAGGSEFAVIVLPCGDQVHADLFAKIKEEDGGKDFDADFPQAKLQSLCRDSGILCYSLVNDFREAAGRSQPLFFNRRNHLTPAGHQLAAQSLLRYLSGTSVALKGEPRPGY